MENGYYKMYIAVLNEVPDYITPTLVAHSVLGAHLEFTQDEFEHKETYLNWLENSFRKCVVKVSKKEFDKINSTLVTYLGHENKTLDGKKSCAVILPVMSDNIPNVLKFSKLWNVS